MRPAATAVALACDGDGYAIAPTRVVSLVRAIVEERRAIGNGYADGSFYLDAEDAPDRRFAPRGGFWNASDPSRAAEGITLSDVTALRQALLGIGVRVSADDADAFLCACERGKLRTVWKSSGRSGRDPDAPEYREAILERKRDRMAARRELARANGFCIVCLKVRTVEAKATCAGCQRSANRRLVARRSKARKAARARAARAARKAKGAP
jgi:hypothetical protein